MVPRPDLRELKQTVLRAPKDRTLRFREDGTFHIGVFEDLHFAEDDEKDEKSKKVMSTILSKEDIDFIVINGDLVSGERTQKADSKKYIDSVVSPLVEKGYSWASTYGNHDSEVNLNPEDDMLEEENKYTNSLTQSMISGDKAGITDYYLPVFSHGQTNTSTPTLLLWFFDSKGGHYYQKQGETGPAVKRPSWIHESVIEWFTKTNSELNKKYGKAIPSLAFYHIPAHAMLEHQQTKGVNPHLNPGVNLERVNPQGTGEWTYDGQDVKFMDALLHTEGLIAGFSGHDHQNDWCFKWNGSLVDHDLTGNGINMCYGRHTGYGGYGNLARGGRQILLHEDNLANDTETWIRLEDGSAQAHVTLNTTYGQDTYPAVTNGAGKPDSSMQGSLLPFSWLWVPLMMFSRWKM
ncbi:hypothetical protein DTO013E5_8872 [Penicillium roqueforti]|uniref:uncharacterized protein n=1 Tax=Penicillium roqueforti TaxID=5082 RepID=UPI00190D595B|nr:uncharacterized protein LCP9604111_7152 [Penicillium roqueforti]KAF9244760.1 hypothetical protein LCP9604111_7152 [Penicillium roqueforti]KAI2690621.1 hypothetical protein CBS147355_1072 [Penicillium roqueforti]KAI2711502.1 hypothetical protein CBS147318_8170 [Penicillium roqueforti]KAI2716785.1 hypothetical protein CBS147354_6780 [Penicillium roqueforti]KAI2740793.1 hypothetical protein DTO012A1_5137 [Penicillium roqueforti]